MNVSKGLRAFVLGAVALGTCSSVFATVDHRAQSRASRVHELLRERGLELKRKAFTLDGDELQKYYDAAIAFEKAKAAGKKKGESDEDYVKRLKPPANDLSDAVVPLVKATVDQLGTFGGPKVVATGDEKTLEILFTTTGQAKDAVAKAVIKIIAKNGEVEKIELEVYKRQKEE